MAIRSRVASVDVVKGIAITLVVLGHVMQGASHRGWLIGNGYKFADTFIYSFHMAAFFFVAGLFVQSSIAKRGTAEFVGEKVRTVLYPYLLWTLLGSALLPIVGRFEMSASHTLKGTILGIAIGDASWFLFTLFFILMLALLTHKMPNFVRLIFGIVLCLIWPTTGHGAIDNIMKYFVFLAAGEWIGRKLSSIESIPLSIALPGSIVLFGAQSGVIVLAGSGLPELPRYLFLSLGLVGTAALFLTVQSLRATPISRLFAWLGKASIGIFLLHPYFQGVAREFTTHILHTTRVAPQIILPTIMATLGPAIIYSFRSRLHISALFSLPMKPVVASSPIKVANGN